MKLENSHFNFPIIKFDSDNILANHIKEPFPIQSFFFVLVGKPGSGKTSLLLNILSLKDENRVYYQVFDKILYVCPNTTRKNIKNNPFDELPDDQKFESFSHEVLIKIKEIRSDFDEEKKERKKKKKRIQHQLLIIDDCTAELKQKENIRTFIEIITNRRQFRLSVILLVQFLRSIPRPIRFQITDIVLFKTSNRMDSKIIQEEYVNMNNEKFLELTNFCWNSPHDFIFINKDKEIYYKNLQRIVFDNENENEKKNKEL